MATSGDSRPREEPAHGASSYSPVTRTSRILLIGNFCNHGDVRRVGRWTVGPGCGTITGMTTFVRERCRAGMSTAGLGRTRRGAIVGGVIGVALMTLASCTGSSGQPVPDASSGGANPAATGSTSATGTGLIPPDTGGDDSSASVGAASAPAAANGPPDAALLSWLDGAATRDGVVTGTAGERWVGRAAGEYAVLGDGWYRYFGADGSIVGCTSAGACVGVGADGTVAVVAAPHDLRSVYQPDGRFLGRFNSDGEKDAAAGGSADFATALTGSGVDLAGLVNAASRGAPFAGGITGDPHVITMGGQRYTTQATGQYDARSGDPDHRIQLQFSPMPHRHDVSVVSLVAIGAAHRVVMLDTNGALAIDGERQPAAAAFTQTGLADGVEMGYWPAAGSQPATLAVVWPDGGMVTAIANGTLGITVVTHLHPAQGTTGLFGSAAIAGGPDLAARSGPPGAVESSVRSWRVAQENRLLPPPTVSPSGSKPADVDPSARTVAARLCGGHGMTQSQDVSACAFDVAVTGDTGFIPGHVALAMAAQTTGVPAGFARRWPALAAGPVAAASDLPTSGRIEIAIAPAGAQLYRLTAEEPGPVRLTGDNACSGAEAADGMDQPSWRLFDAGGRPVSDRLPLCGSAATSAVPAGDYLLAVANGAGKPPLRVSATVTEP